MLASSHAEAVPLAGELSSFPVGASVEYLSSSKGAWIPAKIVASPDTAKFKGLYDLDCKVGVPCEKLRNICSTLQGSIRSLAAPVQLVHVCQKNGHCHFEVDEAAVKFLESYGQRRIAICTVCGPYRSGKSFLLNRLLGRTSSDPQFGVGSTTRACTEGLWLWGEADTRSGSEPALLYMDCEGFGSTDSDKTRDAKLMALCLLMSSVFMLNTKGVLSESLFNTLSLVSHFSKHIDGNKQSMSQPSLLWLLRDFVLDLQDEHGQRMSADEYLERALHAQPLAGADAQRSQAAREVRESLVKSFPQRHCETLVQPVVDEDKLRCLRDLPEHELRPEFRSQLTAVRAKVRALAAEHPKSIAGRPLTGAALAGLLRHFVDTLNANQSLSVKNAWDGVQNSACAALLDELHSEAHTRLKEISNGAALPSGRSLPVSNEELSTVVDDEKRRLQVQWQDRALGDDATRHEYYQDLTFRVAMETEALEAKNIDLAETELDAAVKSWEAWLTSDKSASDKVSAQVADPRTLSRLLSRGLPEKPAARAACRALEQAQAAVEERDEKLRQAQMQAQKLDAQLKEQKQAADAVGVHDKRHREVEQVNSKHCACNAVPFFGFRRQFQSRTSK
jgi:hypothetical protein